MKKSRLCLQCGKENPAVRTDGSKWNFGHCFKCKEKSALRPRKDGMVLAHHCLAGGGTFDPYRPCRCKLLVTEDEAQILVEEKGFVDLATREPVFTGGPIVQPGKLLRVPRCPTLERPHLERAFNTNDLYGKSIEELKKIVEADHQLRQAEERYRVEAWGELAKAFIARLVREVDAATFDKQMAHDWGRPMTFGGAEDERTSHGTDTTFDLDFDLDQDPDEIELETGESRRYEEPDYGELNDGDDGGNHDPSRVDADGDDEEVTLEELSAA